MSPKDFVTWLGMAGGDSRSLWSCTGEGKAFNSTSGAGAAQPAPGKVIRGTLTYWNRFLPFAPRNPRLKQCKFILPECCMWWFSSSPGWTRSCTQVKFVIRSSVGGYEQNSLKFRWTSVLMSDTVHKVKTFHLSVILYMQLENIRNKVICNNNNTLLHPLQKFGLMKPEC